MVGFVFIFTLSAQVDSSLDTSKIDTTSFTSYRLKDFRMPESGAMKLFFNLSGNASDNSYSSWNLPYYPDDDTIFFKRKTEDIGGLTEGYFDFERDKEKFSYRLLGIVDISTRATGESSLWSMPVSDSLITSSIHYASGSIRLYGKMLYYPFGDIFYAGASAGLDNGFTFRRDTQFIRVDSFLFLNHLVTSRSYGDTLTFNPEFGFGRIRSLTYASNALEMAEVLQRKYHAARNPELVKEVAGLYARRWEYPIKYWHADWEFYEDLEGVFTKYGIPREEMNIKEWMEIIDASSLWNSRPFGWKITFFVAGLNQIFYTSWVRDNNSFYPSALNVENLDLYFSPNGVEFTWGYPLSYRTNLTGSVGISFYPGLEFSVHHDATNSSNQPPVVYDTIITNTKLDGYNVKYSTSSATYIWNHFNFSPWLSGSFGKRVLYYDESIAELWIDNEIGLSARYYFTNKFSFGVSGGFFAGFERINSLPLTYSLHPKAGVSLYYRIF